jgi:hypothetical protein
MMVKQAESAYSQSASAAMIPPIQPAQFVCAPYLYNDWLVDACCGRAHNLLKALGARQ